jgi:D-alanine-D-alanine ligase
VEAFEGLADAIVSALGFDTKVLVEECLSGVELAVSVLDDAEAGGARALPPVEIVARGGVFGYDARFEPDAVEYFAPARLTPGQDADVRAAAVRVHEVLGCRDVSRTDLFLTPEGLPVVIECNTSPGMTETSLLPMAVAAQGLTFAEVCDGLVKAALARR